MLVKPFATAVLLLGSAFASPQPGSDPDSVAAGLGSGSLVATAAGAAAACLTYILTVKLERINEERDRINGCITALQGELKAQEENLKEIATWPKTPNQESNAVTYAAKLKKLGETFRDSLALSTTPTPQQLIKYRETYQELLKTREPIKTLLQAVRSPAPSPRRPSVASSASGAAGGGGSDARGRSASPSRSNSVRNKSPSSNGSGASSQARKMEEGRVASLTRSSSRSKSPSKSPKIPGAYPSSNNGLSRRALRRRNLSKMVRFEA